MSDDLPPLVEQRPSSTWPPAPPTPNWANAAVVPGQMYTPAGQGWGGFEGGGWGAAAPGVLTPMFPANTMQQVPPPGWGAAPNPGVGGPSPAVTQIPIPTGTVAQGNDSWAHHPHPRQQTPGPGWKEMTMDDFPSRYTSPTMGPGALTRRSSSRPHTPFSGDSSSSSRDSELSRFAPASVKSLMSGGLVSEYDKRPPREWRSDFTLARRTLGSAIGSLLNISRPKSAARRGSISYPKVTIHSYLRYSPTSPTMFLDLRESPINVRFRHLGKPTTQWDLTRFVCEPPQRVMIFYSPFFPWYIEARASNPVGVTLQDMFTAIWQCMRTQITSEDYYNNEMDQEARERIAIAWSQRCGDDQEERAKGVRRVDFLMEKVGLEGITKGKDGKWELKVKKV